MNEEEFRVLSAGFALGALSPDDAQTFRIAREQHPEWERMVEIDLDTAGRLGDAVVEQTPPPAVRDRLLAAIGDLPQEANRDAPEPAQSAPPARRWGRIAFALAASLALLVGIGWGAGTLVDRFAADPATTALTAIEASDDAREATVDMGDGEATLHWSESVGDAVLVTDGLPVLRDDQTFELWFVRDGAAISAGTFAARDGAATALLEGEMHTGDLVAVTVEPAGGAPDGVPTSDPIMAIETA